MHPKYHPIYALIYRPSLLFIRYRPPRAIIERATSARINVEFLLTFDDGSRYVYTIGYTFINT